jgi:nicotinate-nucleotide adenylyltransferase
MIKTAIFSGSFNPIHVGHLLLANYLCEFTDVEEVWLMVSPQNPLKETVDTIDSRARMEMVQLAVDDDPRFVASDFELNLPQPTYSIRTLTKLREQFSDREFSLLIGADNWGLFDQWKDYRQILDNFSIWIYPRLGFAIEGDDFFPSVHLLTAPIVELSSTFIRDAITQGKDMRCFVSGKVWDYIKNNNLYRL